MQQLAQDNQARKATLVFPATHPDGQKYLEAAREREERVVAASSIWDAELAEENSELLVLPYVHDSSFSERFKALIEERDIAAVYAPVAAVYSWLSSFIRDNDLPVTLLGGSPIKREMARFHKVLDKAKNYRDFIDACAGGHSDLSELEIASVLRMAGNIYGESNEHKIAAVMGIFASAPKGDVIEIGSLVGKSASVLTWLARRYQIGNVLAVDPWLAGPSVQHDSPDTVRVDMVGEWDYEILPQDFVLNTLPIGMGCLNYLRRESVAGFELFRHNPSAETAAFGKVDYEGRIAVIHIDGNHDYAQVKLDCDLWLQLLAPDGWLILDDYLWAHGDGPRRVGDALLEQRLSEIERAFVCGKALFVKFRG